MNSQRIFPSAEHFVPSQGEPIRRVVTTSADCVVVAWHVEPGQTIPPHRHPTGQDTWTVLTGGGDYILSASGATMPIRAGDVVIAHANEVHGVHNRGAEPIRFISVVAPAEAGYELLTP